MLHTARPLSSWKWHCTSLYVHSLALVSCVPRAIMLQRAWPQGSTDTNAGDWHLLYCLPSMNALRHQPLLLPPLSASTSGQSSCFQDCFCVLRCLRERVTIILSSKYMIGSRKCLETLLSKWDAWCFIIHKCLSETCSWWIAIYTIERLCTRGRSATGRLEQHKGVLCINDEVAFCCKQSYISPMKMDTVLTSVIFTYTRSSGILLSSTFHMK